jgi:poly [ADP-ribose] polymerase
LNVTEANKLLKDVGHLSDVDPIVDAYQKLRCQLEPVAQAADEFVLVEKYLRQTHAPTHSGYTLHLQSLFRATREGESERYQPWSNFHNRRLLWHGSRLTNWAGILSQGLRIAPPGKCECECARRLGTWAAC